MLNYDLIYIYTLCILCMDTKWANKLFVGIYMYVLNDLNTCMTC